ncbi:HpcH/HpaI aldolase/citrate lyase family protein [Qipengyuania flava]|uniref:HpcH/HpaI aldolase/citrate lyase family protein n=1 Tax=Qipengyuania flava TaxID=192812 RepID=UPI001C638D60|nr:aldolase/citrate lyase family protein [Qipengyuania flava]QYJ07871.1 CoA ester lyase [Qipengyuania flava]
MRSWILVPADNDKALDSVAGAGADVVVVDLARAMTSTQHSKARIETTNWLRSHREQVVAARRFERWARISGLDTPHWREDLDAAMDGSPHGIVLANCRGTDDIRQLASVLYEIEDRLGLAANVTRIVPELGSTPSVALTVNRLTEELHPRVSALTWDAVGLAHAIGARRLRGPGGRWSDALAHVRAQVLLIAHARGIGALEHPFRDTRDTDTGKRVAEAARADGFTGMFAIHAGQLAGINEAFAPLDSELAEARSIVSAFATNPGASQVALGDRRIGQNDLQRAKRLLGED